MTRLHLTRRGHTGCPERSLARFLAGGLAFSAAVVLAPAARALEDAEQATVTLAKAAPAERAQHPRQKSLMKREWGVEPLFVRQTAAGYMLEFRYKVLDPQKAQPLFERRTKPMLTHVETGSKFIVPTPAKTGALRNSNPPLAGHVYWMFFANPGKLVKPGERVNIEIGAYRADGLVVK